MVALSSSNREGTNPAIRARVFSISAFDAPWYLEVNGISGVPASLCSVTSRPQTKSSLSACAPSR
jgi:hypothetical protein